MAEDKKESQEKLDLSNEIKSEAQKIKEEIKTVKKEINISKESQKNTNESETATISFKGTNSLKNFVKKSPGIAPKKEEEKKPTVEEIKNDIKKYEEKQDKFDYEDFETGAEVAVDVFETIIVSILRWWAKDNTDVPYSLTETKRKRIVKLLIKVLIKYQAKFSLGFLLLLTVITSFLTAGKKARDHRKEVLKLEEENKKKLATTKVKEIIPADEVKQDEKKDSIKKTERRGKQPKDIDTEKIDEKIDKLEERIENKKDEVITPEYLDEKGNTIIPNKIAEDLTKKKKSFTIPTKRHGGINK